MTPFCWTTSPGRPLAIRFRDGQAGPPAQAGDEDARDLLGVAFDGEGLDFDEAAVVGRSPPPANASRGCGGGPSRPAGGRPPVSGR
ncbi:hypothetical protein QFZ24_009793 [Streptomyces phaeochromogenes]|uniref:hypothetical protein n=1 Tax=Streptomyces phaeochromogenes TaxID=1923 RepID=UPI0027906DBD|nr:hypothetical protein [Streptomyces phaeochromogenes]MDQ0955784.1 hypothetical protein [Streptomyces phaeochromogenes]